MDITYVYWMYCNIYLVREQPFIVCQDLDVSLSLFTATPLKTANLPFWTCLITLSSQHCFATHGCTIALLTADRLDLLVTHAYILVQSTPEPSHRTLANLGLLSVKNNLGGGGGGELYHNLSNRLSQKIISLLLPPPTTRTKQNNNNYFAGLDN